MTRLLREHPIGDWEPTLLLGVVIGTAGRHGRRRVGLALAGDDDIAALRLVGGLGERRRGAAERNARRAPKSAREDRHDETLS